MRRSNLRGRRPGRADRRSGTDEKRIRARSAILDKNQTQTAFAFINNRGFGTDELYIRTKTTVGARSAQWPLLVCDGNPDAAYKKVSCAAVSFQGQYGAGMAAVAPLLAVVEKMPERG